MIDHAVFPPDTVTGSVRGIWGIVRQSGFLSKGPADSQWACGVSKQSTLVVLYQLDSEVI